MYIKIQKNMALKKNIYLFIYFLIVKSVLSYTYALHVKGIVHPKKKMYLSSDNPGCRWVCSFVGTDLEKFSITSLAHQWILCSEWVPSELESKQLIKTSQVIHMTPVHQLMSYEVKK